MPTRRIRLALQYDGSGYFGWQMQPNGPTIQEEVQAAIRKITGEETTVHGAGRTDAGVHALGQVACFDTGSYLDVGVIRRALNSVLPACIRITDASVAPKGFHPRFSAKSKRYVYLIVNSPVVSPFVRRYAWSVPFALNLGAMRQAAGALVGSRDFSCFRASGCDARTSHRTMFSIDIGAGATESLDRTLQEGIIRVAMEADGFLRHMARNIVGTLVEVGRGRMEIGSMEDLLLSADRRRAGPTAPPWGLFLERVVY